MGPGLERQVSYLSSAPAAGQSHSALLPSTVAAPRGHRRTTRSYGLGEGKKNAVTLTKGYPRTPGFRTGHLQRVPGLGRGDTGLGSARSTSTRAPVVNPAQIPARAAPLHRRFPVPNPFLRTELPPPRSRKSWRGCPRAHLPPARPTRACRPGDDRAQGGRGPLRPPRAAVPPADTEGARGETGPMERQTDGNGRGRGRGGPRTGTQEGAGKGKPGPPASTSAEGAPTAHVGRASRGRRDLDHFGQGARTVHPARFPSKVEVKARTALARGLHRGCDPRSLTTDWLGPPWAPHGNCTNSLPLRPGSGERGDLPQHGPDDLAGRHPGPEGGAELGSPGEVWAGRRVGRAAAWGVACGAGPLRLT